MSIFGRRKQNVFTTPMVVPQNTYKTRFAMLGTIGSGKTTICGTLLITAHTLSQDVPGFFCHCVEYGSGIREAASKLRRGIFPPKTRPTTKHYYESGLIVRWEGRWGSKQVQIPICDLPGEQLQTMIGKFHGQTNPVDFNQHYQSARDLINYVKDSEGFIIVVPAPRAYFENTQIEKEPEDLSEDPDVNISQILEQVRAYKEESRGRKIKGIAVVISKWDLLAPYAEQYGMNLYTPGGIQHFMNHCFPDTMMQLKNYKDKIQFFPSYVQVEREDDGKIRRWPKSNHPHSNTMKIEVDRKGRRPKYDEQSFIALFDWLRTFAS